jgi:Zn-dependent membrane protease YugP
MIGIIIILMILSFAVSATLKRKIRKYSQIGTNSGLTGSDVAARMLRENGINDVKVTCTGGQLTDHYNPSQKTVNLSEEIYHGRSVASVAIAAHECGHAIQHEDGYTPLKLRTVYEAFPINQILLLIIACYFVLTLFSLITLPVEFNASNRAMSWLMTRGIVDNNESVMAKDALKWAAMTYIVAAIGSLVTLLYYVMILTGGSRD